MRSRWFPVFLFLLVGFPWLQYQTLSRVVPVLDGADLGLVVDEEMRLRSASRAWPGTRKGDKVLAVQGVPTDVHHGVWSAHESVPPGPITVRFERDGAAFELTEVRAGKTDIFRWGVWIRVLSGMLLMLMALGAFAANPQQESFRFLILCYALGALSQFEWMVDRNWLLRSIQWTLIPFVGALAVHLFCTVPTPLGSARARRWLLAICYAPGFVLPFGTLSWIASDYTASWGRPALSLTWVVLPLCACTNIILIVRELVRAHRARDRKKVQIYRAMLAAAIGLVLPAIVSVLMTVLGIWTHERGVWHMNVSLLLVFGLSAGYVVVRHNALKVDRFTAAIIGYAITIALLVGALLALLLGISLAFDRVSELPTWVYVTVTAGVTLSLGPVSRRVQRRINRLFYREEADATRSFEVLQQLVRTTQDKPRDEACREVLKALELIQPDGAAVWVLTDDGQAFRRYQTHGAAGDGLADDVALTGPLGTAMSEDEKGGGLRDLSPKPLSLPAQGELFSRNLVMAVPIRAYGMTLGMLAVGRKRSGLGYPQTELGLLGAIAAQAAVILSRPTEGSQVGRYRIERRLGVGGMAEVFLAWQLGPGGFERKVALKRPLPELIEDPACAAMFLDEARIASQLQHRNISQIFEIDRHNGAYFIVMEYVDGPSVRQVIRSGHTVPVPIALAIAHALLSALGHAHARKDPHGNPLGVVHRDVTPSNILINSDGEPKLLDFGIARAGARMFKTQTGTVRGTLPYMAPEQALGKPLDARADVFSAGAVIYELLTRTMAFSKEGTIMWRSPRAPSELQPGLPHAIDSVLLKAMAYDPVDRYASADDLKSAIEAAMPETIATSTELAKFVASLKDGRPVAVSHNESPRPSLEDPTMNMVVPVQRKAS